MAVLWRQLCSCVPPQPVCYVWVLTAGFWQGMPHKPLAEWDAIPWAVASHHFPLEKKRHGSQIESISCLKCNWTCPWIDQEAAHLNILCDSWVSILAYSFPLFKIAFLQLSQWFMLKKQPRTCFKTQQPWLPCWSDDLSAGALGF